MRFVVPFDGSELAETVPGRASEFSDVPDERVVAVAVIPEGTPTRPGNGTGSARRRPQTWTRRGDGPRASPPNRAVANVRRLAVNRYAPTGKIRNELSVARDEHASMLVVGSEDAGRIVNAVTSVGGSVSSRVAFGLVIVRNKRSSTVARLRNAGDTDLESEFFVT